jgi:hypothetical protein
MILNAIETPPSILQIIFGTLVAIKQHTKNWEWALLCLMVFFFFEFLKVLRPLYFLGCNFLNSNPFLTIFSVLDVPI